LIPNLADVSEQVANWPRTVAIAAPGASGLAAVRSLQAGNVRLRVVEYAPGYLADHWCSEGHILYVVAGALAIEHEDGAPAHLLAAGVGWYVSDGQVPAHRVRCEQGATVFIVDSLSG
jgi:hypothetical protein